MEPSRTPPGRYDPPRRLPVGPLATGVAVLLGVLVLTGGYLLFARHSSRSASGSVVGYTVLSDSSVEVRFDVRRPTGRAAVCVVRARDAQGRQVGTADVPVPATPAGTVRVERVLATDSRASTGEVDRCVVRP